MSRATPKDVIQAQKKILELLDQEIKTHSSAQSETARALLNTKRDVFSNICHLLDIEMLANASYVDQLKQFREGVASLDSEKNQDKLVTVVCAFSNNWAIVGNKKPFFALAFGEKEASEKHIAFVCLYNQVKQTLPGKEQFDALREKMVKNIENKKSQITDELIKSPSERKNELRKNAEVLKKVETTLASLDSSKSEDRKIIAQLGLYLRHEFQLELVDESLMNQVVLQGSVSKNGYAASVIPPKEDIVILPNPGTPIRPSYTKLQADAFSLQEAEIFDAIMKKNKFTLPLTDQQQQFVTDEMKRELIKNSAENKFDQLLNQYEYDRSLVEKILELPAPAATATTTTSAGMFQKLGSKESDSGPPSPKEGAGTRPPSPSDDVPKQK